MTFQIERATKEQARGRIGLVGPAGSGKTYTLLVIATELARPDGKIVVIDTEHKSSAKYSDLFEFDVLHLAEDYDPERYVKAIKYCEQQGYDVIGIDGLSHAWTGTGGALQQVDDATVRSRGNQFAGWRVVTPKHNALVEAMLQSDAHIIATMRSKTDYVVEINDKGKAVPKKVGMAPVQREGMDYEFDIVFDIDTEHRAIVSKTRCAALTDKIFAKLSTENAKIIRDWLSDGVVVEPNPEITPASQVVTATSAHTIQELFEWAKKEHELTDDRVKDILKEAGHTGFSPSNWDTYVVDITNAV